MPVVLTTQYRIPDNAKDAFLSAFDVEKFDIDLSGGSIYAFETANTNKWAVLLTKDDDMLDCVDVKCEHTRFGDTIIADDRETGLPLAGDFKWFHADEYGTFTLGCNNGSRSFASSVADSNYVLSEYLIGFFIAGDDFLFVTGRSHDRAPNLVIFDIVSNFGAEIV